MILWFLACGLSPAPDLLDEGEVAVSAPVVALITIDTWRADHLSAELTPTIWALAEEGERYDKAYSPMGLTTPAHATMLTGLYPWEHGVEANNHHGYALRGDVEVLPDQFSGWSSGAFVSAYPAGPDGALARGWDVFEGPAAGERPGATAIDAAMAWLPKDKPSLLWVHVYEPHGPYEGTGATERARYGQEVSRADAALTPLITLLRKRGATIVVTADHGEVLDEERCGYQHERSISDHVLRVPLVRWSPGITPSVSEALTGLVDIPALLKGETLKRREYVLAQSGMCESDCAQGCSPPGLSGRDAVVITAGGRWVSRPGRGTFAEGKPLPEAQELLVKIPALKEASAATTDAARSLGYIDP